MANGGSVIFKFQGDTTDLDKSTKKTESAISTLAKSFTIAEVASKGLSKGISVIKDNLDGAIKRFDTMRNFPKVMASLGFESEDASKAVQTLSDGLLGLPTALNDSITYVQRFTAKNNDLEKSSKIFLAINDAILAGGASAETQASAIEQFAQSFSKGKPDLMEWRSLLTAMPGQLKQVAQAMGYASADDLYEAFKKNKVSMDDFIDTIIRLDEEGSESMASFKEQAKNATGGIATSFTNLKTRITRAITEAINKVDSATQKFGGISGIIENIGKKATDFILKIAEYIPGIIEDVSKVINVIKDIINIINEGLKEFGGISGIIQSVINGIKDAINFVNDALSGVGGFLGIIKTVFSGVKDIFKTVTTVIKEVVDALDWGLIEFGGIKGVIGEIGNIAKKVFKNIVDAIKNVAKFIGQALKIAIDYKDIIIKVGSAILAWKAGLKIAEGLKLAIEGSKKATLLYKGVVMAFNAVQAIWNGLIVAGKVAVALFTGQITLAQVATALWAKIQAVLNGVLSANPIGAVLVGVVALTAGIVALCNAMDASSEEAKKEADAIKELKEKADETKKSFDDLHESQNQAISQEISHSNYIQSLANELKTLADETGNVQDKDRARAEFILGQLNEALGTEYTMTGNQIQQYQELSASIDQLIEKKKLEVLFEKRKEEYSKSLLEWEDLLKQKEEARLKLEEEMNKGHNFWTRTENENLATLQERYQSLDDAVNQAGMNIRSYEDAMTANLQGNTEKALQLLQNQELGFKSFDDTVKLGTEEQTRVLKEQQDIAIQNFMNYAQKFKEGVDGYTTYGLQKAYDYAEKAKQEYTRAGQNIGEGLSNGINQTQGQVNSSMNSITNGMTSTFKNRLDINSPSGVYYDYGVNVNRGLINGLNSNSGSVFGVIGSIANGLISSVQNILGIHSPSRVFRDEIGKNMALGIGIGFENAIVGVESNINKSVADMIPNLDLGNVFDLSPTLHNTTSSNSNVNVTIYNNMETDMMGNLINNIKTYSNGAKNDYNYGMA